MHSINKPKFTWGAETVGTAGGEGACG